MSPAPTMPVSSRIADIQSRIAGLRTIGGGAAPALLGPGTDFEQQLAQAVQGQSGRTPSPEAPATASEAATALLAGLVPGAPTSAQPGAIPGVTGALGLGLTGPVGRPGSVAAPFGPVGRPAGSAADPLTPGSDFGEAIVALASREIGTPYVWGGESDAEGGYDCSGLILHAYRQAGIELPRVSRDQARAGEPVASLDQAIPGDLVAFGEPVNHIGIYAGDGMMVVAPHTGAVVRLQAIERTPTAIRRIVPAGTVVAAPDAPTPAAMPGAGSGPLAEVPYAAELNRAAAMHGIDPRLLAAVARTESGFRPDAVSPAGAQGLMQIMPATARHLGVDPLDPAQAAEGAARYLAEQLDTFGTVELALAAYNAGPGNVRKYGGIPPFTETRRYVQRVMESMGDMR